MGCARSPRVASSPLVVIQELAGYQLGTPRMTGMYEGRAGLHGKRRPLHHMSRIWANQNAGEMVFRHDFNSQDPLTGMEWHVGHLAWRCQFNKLVCHLWSKDGAATASN